MQTTAFGRWVAAPAAALLITAGGVATPASAASAPLAASRPSKVTVPGSYVYNPKLGPRHDYCTLAPDEFPAPLAPNADFRGPCARHDLCYDSTSSKKSCDKGLRKNMYRNCEHYYGKYNPLRASCKAAALVYWAAVTANR